MEPTLQNNDRLIVWKLPETWSKITGHAYIPNRGDIIIFHEPALGGKQLIKRVLGLPGDRVVVKDNTVTIYNLAHPNGFDPDTTLPYGKVLNNVPTSGEEDITVQAGQVFVFGDNRPNSLDSRVFGVVNSKDIIGKLAIRVVPLNKAKSF
jgi:signal peptidase I